MLQNSSKMNSFTSKLKSIRIDNQYELLTDGFCFYFFNNKHLAIKEPDFKWCAIVVLPGAVTDFASVPRIFRKWFPRKGRHVAHAAVIHDVCYQFGIFNRKTADRLFAFGLRTLGLSKVKTKVMYSAVRAFGWIYWNKYRKREKENCSPNRYYSVLDKPVIIEKKDRFLEIISVCRYYEEKILPRAQRALLKHLNLI